MRRKISQLLFVSIISITIIGCNVEGEESTIEENEQQVETAEELASNLNRKDLWIDPTQDTIEGRVLVPEGFVRKEVNAYGTYMRELPLLADGSPVLLFDGKEKVNQNIHIAVLDLDVGLKDLQQCADAALRIRCEFLFQSGEFEKINYHLTNGDEFAYIDYRDGYRLQVDGNKTTLVKTAERDESYEGFRSYLEVLFTYAGTISVQAESILIKEEEMEIGDIFIIGGSPGHCIIVMDLCENEAGEVKFLLGQSYMPAQDIHILKNPNSESPWYSLNEIEYPFETPSWTFQEACLRRMY